MDFNKQRSSSSSSFCNVEAAEKIESRDEALTLSDLNLQEPSSKSSYSAKQEEMDKIGDGQEEKNLKADSQLEPENQDETEVEDKSLIDELPSEMVTKILKYLNVKSLLNSRLVSRKWNEMAQEIIQSSDGAETFFYCDGNTFSLGIWSSERAKENPKCVLETFVKHFDDSKESLLYTSYRFHNMIACTFDHAVWLKFASGFGASVKSLRLAYTGNANFHELKELAAHLRNLLVNQLPNLQEFGLDFPYWVSDPRFSTSVFPAIPLFPTVPTSNEGKTIQLAHLKVLYLDKNCILKYSAVTMDLLRAAVNLQKIEPFVNYHYYTEVEIFQLLQTVGKLGCLQNAVIRLTDDFMSHVQGQTLMGFKLKKLLLNVLKIYNNEAVWPDASIFLSHLFESIKDTLRHLEMTPIGFLPALQLPKFSKLTELSIVDLGHEDKIRVLPKGLDLSETFRLLNNLELQKPWVEAFPNDESQEKNVSSLPNLKTLKITGHEMTKEDIVRISQMCPNLKQLYICNDCFGSPIKNFPEVGTAIWTHLTRLVTLILEIDPSNDFPAVDSCFTGFSGEDVIRIHKEMIQAEELLENPGSLIKIPQSNSQSELETERKNPSILDLKDLKSLEVCLLYLKTGWRDPDPISCHKTFAVSNKLAFQLMENLSYDAKCCLNDRQGCINNVPRYFSSGK